MRGRAVVAAALAAACAPGAPTALRVTNVLLVPGAGLAPGVVYAEIENPGTVPDTVTEVIVTGAASAMLHSSGASAAGNGAMQILSSLEVPARGAARLAPGGVHAMLNGLREGLKRGDSVRVAFRLAHAGNVATFARVIDYADVDSLTHRARN